MVWSLTLTLTAAHSSLRGRRSVTKGREDNKYRLLPDGGPGPPSGPSLCHTSGVGKSVSQSLKDCVGHCKTSANFQHCYSMIQPRQHPPSVNSAESSSQRHGYKNHRNEASCTGLLELKRLSRAVFYPHLPELQWNVLGNCFRL